MTKESELIEQIVGRYDADTGMLIPILQDIQADCGYLPLEYLQCLANSLDIPMSRIYAVATFYTSFRLAPKGQHDVILCMGTVCYLKGAPKICEAISREFQVEPGSTTRDRLFTLQAVNCVGACALAPVMIVDGKYYDDVTPESALEVLNALSPAEEAAETTPKEAES